MLKYTPLGGQLLQDDRRDLDYYSTHTNNHGPMNISITYSRHSTPKTQSIMTTSMNQYWNGHSTYPPAANAFNRLPISTRNQKRHQPGRVQKDENDTKESTANLSPRTQEKTSHRSNYQKLHATGQVRPSIAPHSLQAETLHRLRPITSGTTLVGRRLGGFHNRQNKIGYH